MSTAALVEISSQDRFIFCVAARLLSHTRGGGDLWGACDVCS